MAPSQSFLSDPWYGYDAVVATTQESINAGLVQYMMNKHPIRYMFFFMKGSDGEKSVVKSLDEMLKISGGIK
jgi:GTP-binding protein EngB required for normal cell division